MNTNHFDISRQQSQPRGSAIILVLVTLTLLTVLGTVYLQTTSIQRFAVAKVEGDIDTAANATAAQIGALLVGDITDTGDGTTEWHDYGWTNPDAADSDNAWAASPFLAGPDASNPAYGGKLDNAWLASNAPLFDTNRDGTDETGAANWDWVHISNLNGFFLRNVTGSGTEDDLSQIDDITNSSKMAEDIVDFGDDNDATDGQADGNLQRHDGYIPLNTAMLVDADGDGIKDSRWTWAGIPQINGFFYVAAVRVVDLSGMANANVWLSTIDATGAYDNTIPGADAPHWKLPTELDLGRFVHDIDSSKTGELSTLLDYRHNNALSLAGAIDITTAERNAFWANQGRYLAQQTGHNLFTSDDEFELRRNNGVSNGGSTTAIEDNALGGLTTFLRDGGSETDYSTAYTDEQDFFQEEPRHQLTTLSGAAILTPKLQQDSSSVATKVDINGSTIPALQAEIEKVVNGAQYLAGGFNTDTEGFAAQLAVNIADYTDADQLISYTTDSATNTYYGLEMLPMLVEVYVQRGYQITAVSGSNPYDITWTQQGAPGYAIEIGNPYNVPIAISNDVHLWVDGVDWGGLATLSGESSLDPATSIVLYKNSGDTLGNQDISTQIGSTTSPTNVAITNNWPTDSSTTSTDSDAASLQVSVELRGKNQANVVMTDAYSRIYSYKTTAGIRDTDYNDGGGAAPASQSGYLQHFHIGNGNGFNMLTFGETDVDNTNSILLEDLPLGGIPLTFATDMQLGEKDKGAHPDVDDPTTMQIIVADHSDGTMDHVGELAHVTLFGFSDAETIGTFWASGGATSIDQMRLNFADNNDVPAGSGDLNVPLAAALLDRFTTYNMQSDTLDNDGDSDTDDGEEIYVQGTINLNTAPQSLLEKALPIPDATKRQNVAKAIVDYRMNLGPSAATRDGFSRTLPGIAMLGELFSGDQLLSNSNTGLDVYGAGSVDESASGDSSITVDVLGNWDHDANVATRSQDGINGDREEDLLIPKWLSQVGSVRSDYFAAYLYLQEFQGIDWTGGATNAKRYIVVFKRNVDSSGNVSVEQVGGGLYEVN